MLSTGFLWICDTKEDEVIVSGLMLQGGINASPDCPSMSGWTGLVWLL
jgi:hypothetical protein